MPFLPRPTCAACGETCKRRRRTYCSRKCRITGKARPVADRFWDKVSPEPMSGCWLWTACVEPSGGHGVIRVAGAHPPKQKAHRVSWGMHNGPVPPGVQVLHRCDVASCVNPAHLFVGTQQDNIADMNEKGRRRGPFGEKHRSAKLTTAQVIDIRTRHAAGGVTAAALGREYGIDRTGVLRILDRRSWRHVSDERPALAGEVPR